MGHHSAEWRAVCFDWKRSGYNGQVPLFETEVTFDTCQNDISEMFQTHQFSFVVERVSHLLRNILIGVGVGLGVVIIILAIVFYKKRRNNANTEKYEFI